MFNLCLRIFFSRNDFLKSGKDWAKATVDPASFFFRTETDNSERRKEIEKEYVLDISGRL